MIANIIQFKINEFKELNKKDKLYLILKEMEQMDH